MPFEFLGRAALLLPALCGLAAIASAAPLVDLNARDASAGTATWQNRGTLGAFIAVGRPSLTTVSGVRAVLFDGKQDAYRGPVTPPALEGAAPRTIEVWAFNPTVDADEETIVAWGRRGGPDATAMSLNWGRSGAYGAATHWAADLGWNGVPRPGHWHFLAYTYDGKTARVYDNGVEKASRPVALRTASGFPLTVAAQNDPQGRPQFVNDADGSQMGGSLALASLRIQAGALSAEQIGGDFDADARRFGATRPVSILAAGRDTYTVGPLVLSLLRATQTAAALSPRGAAFDFLPGDRLAQRAADGFYHLGDVTLRTRVGEGPWTSYSSASDRADAVVPVSAPEALAACDLSANLGAGCPLQVTRLWVNDGGRLALRFRMTNRTAWAVEIGALGVPLVFNNLLTDRSLEETHENCSFATRMSAARRVTSRSRG